MPAGDIEKPLDGFQRMSALFGGSEYILSMWVKADGNGMDITLLNEMGANIGELLYTNGKVTLSSAVLPPALNAEYIIADFQFCFYKKEALAKNLENSGFTFSAIDAPQKKRQIFKDGSLIIEINYSRNYIEFNNHLRRYKYILQGEF